jgi:hypothetical protein
VKVVLGLPLLFILFMPFLVACSTTESYQDLAEPITVEDFLPLRDKVTLENARGVVRRGLQMHRRFNDLPDEQF